MVCPKNSRLASDGRCYELCPDGWTAIDNGPVCAKNCPAGYSQSASVNGISLSCIRPSFDREVKPFLDCPDGADRQFDMCLLGCPVGTKKKFNFCVPECPDGFVNTPDGLSCQAEYTKRKPTIREACYENETRVGGRICLSPCPLGYAPDSENAELCYSLLPDNLKNYFWTGTSNTSKATGPILSKIIFSRTLVNAKCSMNYQTFSNQCLAECPKNSQDQGLECVANCPPDFKNNANQTACIRPQVISKQIKNIFQQIGSGIVYVVYGFLLVLFLIIIVTRFA